MDNDWVTFQTTVGNANRLLQTRFAWYQREGTAARSCGRSRIACQTILQTTSTSFSRPPASGQAQRQALYRVRYDQCSPTTLEGQPTWADVEEPEADAVSSLRAADAVPNCNGNLITPRLHQGPYTNINYPPRQGETWLHSPRISSSTPALPIWIPLRRYAPKAAGQSFSVVTFNRGLNDQNSTDDSGG